MHVSCDDDERTRRCSYDTEYKKTHDEDDKKQNKGHERRKELNMRNKERKKKWIKVHPSFWLFSCRGLFYTRFCVFLLWSVLPFLSLVFFFFVLPSPVLSRCLSSRIFPFILILHSDVSHCLEKKVWTEGKERKRKEQEEKWDELYQSEEKWRSRVMEKMEVTQEMNTESLQEEDIW